MAEKAGYKVVPYSVPSTNPLIYCNVRQRSIPSEFPIDNTIALMPQQLSEANKTAKKPIFPSAVALVTGGLGSVVVDQHDLGVATGKMAAKILRGQTCEYTC